MSKSEKESMAKLKSMINNRIMHGKNTTHKDWFEIQCKNLNLDLEKTSQRLRTAGIIRKLSSNKAWPVCLIKH